MLTRRRKLDAAVVPSTLARFPWSARRVGPGRPFENGVPPPASSALVPVPDSRSPPRLLSLSLSLQPTLAFCFPDELALTLHGEALRFLPGSRRHGRRAPMRPSQGLFQQHSLPFSEAPRAADAADASSPWVGGGRPRTCAIRGAVRTQGLKEGGGEGRGVFAASSAWLTAAVTCRLSHAAPRRGAESWAVERRLLEEISEAA